MLELSRHSCRLVYSPDTAMMALNDLEDAPVDVARKKVLSSQSWK
jgi:hypothetical protein